MSQRSIIAMLLAFVVPGGGHFYLGRRARAAAFFVIVLTLFVIGMSIDGRLYRFQSDNLLENLGTAGSMGAGTLYFAGRAVGGEGDARSITYEYGTAFTLTAGLMNLLLILDAFDIAEGRKP
jgi:TM2 domain-containing membrane protein YozV